MKKFAFVLIVIFLASAVFYFTFQMKPVRENDGITVVTTLFPLYDAAKFIGGDNASVSNILPPGIEAHSFEPKPSDIVKINEADIFVYTGPFMEVWAEDTISGISENVTVVDSSKGAILLEGDEHEHDHEVEDEDEHLGEDSHAEEQKSETIDEHDHHGIDPHFWMDFDNMTVIAQNILDAYIKVDPANEAYYRSNFDEYVSKISTLKTSYEKTLSSCTSNNIVYGGHFAFNYLAQKYGLNYYSAQGFSPDSEPSSKDLITLVEFVKQENVSTIYYEELASPKIAETIANETDAKLLMLNGAHNVSKEDLTNGVSFFDIMTANLHNLAVGLNCKDE